MSHIRDVTRRIQDYTRDGQEAFMASTLIQDAVIRNLEIIGEATKALSQAFPLLVCQPGTMGPCLDNSEATRLDYMSVLT